MNNITEDVPLMLRRAEREQTTGRQTYRTAGGRVMRNILRRARERRNGWRLRECIGAVAAVALMVFLILVLAP